LKTQYRVYCETLQEWCSNSSPLSRAKKRQAKLERLHPDRMYAIFDKGANKVVNNA